MALQRWANRNLGRRNPHLVQAFYVTLVNGKAISTKKGYASCILDFARFCSENDEPMFIDGHLNMWAIMYWMQHRVWVLDSSNSHKTWSAAFSWLCRCIGVRPEYQKHPDYEMFYLDIKKAARRKTQAKQPILACHIWRYIRDKLEIVPGKMHEARYDNVLKAFALVAIFLTMSRCMELLWSDKTEDKEVREVITGLRWSDLRIHRKKGFRSDKVLDIRVRFFKNQEDKTKPKDIRIASPCCGRTIDECVCPFFDFFEYIPTLKGMRRDRFADITPFRKSGKGSLGPNQQANLGIGPEDFVFVTARGTICKYDFIRRLVKDLVAFNKLDVDGDCAITPHSLRIGATSLAHNQGIDPIKCMRYVEWSPMQSPTMHAHYVRYTALELSVIPYELLHGSTQFGEPTKNYLREIPTTWELRKEVIRAELYGGPASKSSGGRNRRRPKAPVYDPDPTANM